MENNSEKEEKWMEELATFYKNIKVGDTVWDDLTREEHKIIRIEYDDFGNQGVYLDNEHLDGGRFPWELSPITKG